MPMDSDPGASDKKADSMSMKRFTIYVRHETRALNISGILNVEAVEDTDTGYHRLIEGLRDLGFRVQGEDQATEDAPSKLAEGI
jgi:hypothetical protein